MNQPTPSSYEVRDLVYAVQTADRLTPDDLSPYAFIQCFLFGVLNAALLHAVLAFHRGRMDRQEGSPGKWIMTACGFTYAFALAHLSVSLRSLYLTQKIWEVRNGRMEACLLFLADRDKPQYTGQCSMMFNEEADDKSIAILFGVRNLLLALSILLMNAILFGRAWCLGPCNRTVRIISAALFALSIASSIVLFTLGVLYYPTLLLVGLAMPCINNLWATCLMIWTMKQHSFSIGWSIRHSGSWSRTMIMVALITEPGVVYVILWVFILVAMSVLLGTENTRAFGSNPVMEFIETILTQLVAIYSTVLVILSGRHTQLLYPGGTHIRPISMKPRSHNDEERAASPESVPSLKESYFSVNLDEEHYMLNKPDLF